MFSKMDFRSGYYFLIILFEDILKKPFRTRYGYYDFLVVSFGLTNALTAFMDMMNRVFWPHLNSFVIMLIDDIRMYSRSTYKHT